MSKHMSLKEAQKYYKRANYDEYLKLQATSRPMTEAQYRWVVAHFIRFTFDSYILGDGPPRQVAWNNFVRWAGTAKFRGKDLPVIQAHVIFDSLDNVNAYT